jgi:hypothetical protein
MKNQKEFLTVGEVAGRLNCTQANVYNSMKKGSLSTIHKATYIQTSEGGFVATGERKQYITAASVEEKIAGKGKRRNKGKQIKAFFVDGKEGTFENGKREIVFPSETVAAEKLKIGKFKLRYQMENKRLINDRIKVEKVS